MKTDIKHWGLLRALYIRLMWLLNRALGLNLYWVTRRALTPGGGQSAETRTVIATRETLAPYIDDPAYALPERYVAEAFTRGDVCVAIFAEGRVTGYGWVAYKPVPHEGRIWVEFAPGQRYTTNSFTHPDFRGRHLRGSKGVLDALDRKHGTTHSLSAIHTHNFASLRADARNGAQVVGLAGYEEVFGRVMAFRSAGARRVEFRFHCPDGRQDSVGS